MHLYAIAIYERLGRCDFKRLSSAQKSKGLFAPDDLKTLEESTLRPYLETLLEDDGAHLATVNKENHYINVQGSKIIVIASRNKLEVSECQSLFSNIDYVHSGHIPDKTINDILVNPIGYINPNLRLQNVLTLSAEVQAKMRDNITKAIERGTNLEELEQATIKLNSSSTDFQKGATKLNSCCRW